MKRLDGRTCNESRKIDVELSYLKYAEGSCLISAGDTRIICAASVEQAVPPFLGGSGRGWITAEYSLLPRSTRERVVREAVRGRLNGRTQEIKRFIGRSLRAVVDPYLIGERTIIIDCDIVQADGSTRTLAVTGGFLALMETVHGLLRTRKIAESPIIEYLGATSIGIVGGEMLLDLTYEEDSHADVDMNLVMTDSNRIVELQSTAERRPLTVLQFNEMFEMAQKEIQRIIAFEKEIFSKQ